MNDQLLLAPLYLVVLHVVEVKIHNKLHGNGGTSLMGGYSKCPYIRGDFVHNLCLWDQRKRPNKRGVLIERSPNAY
jgi:hypothetical protein